MVLWNKFYLKLQHESSCRIDQSFFKKVFAMNDEVLTLNVGGKIYTTLKSTLTQKISCEESENFFTALFSNKYFVTKDSKGRLFIGKETQFIFNSKIVMENISSTF